LNLIRLISEKEQNLLTLSSKVITNVSLIFDDILFSFMLLGLYALPALIFTTTFKNTFTIDKKKYKM